MKLIIANLAFLFFFITSVSAVSKPVRCEFLFHTDDRLSKAVRVFQTGNTDTTSLRQEVKYVVKTSDFTNYLPALENVFQKRLKNRDKPAEGFANITSTRYMSVGKYIQNGKKLSAKIRFRKYYTRALTDTNWKQLQVAESLKDRSWLELKIQHPEYENVVFKPRLIILDKDIEKLITEKYFDYRDGIINRLIALNPGKESEVAKFAGYFDALYTTPSMKKENMYAQTQYERTSYSIKLKQSDNPDETIDIQITLDQNIRLTRLSDRQQFNTYAPDETVVEVKIPLRFAKLTPEDIAIIPELAEIKKLIAMLEQKHVLKYPMNKGKMSKIDKKNNQETDDEYENDWD